MSTVGSFCSGFLGLEHGLSQVIDADLAWVADNEPGPSALLAFRQPDVPNLGDLKALDWSQVPAVEWMAGGYPCQPFSQAGQRKGVDDPRHIWPFIAAGIGVLRPRMVLLENVRGHLTLGFGVVLADLAALGYGAAWTVVAASDAGAPHPRMRLFVIAVRDGLAEPAGSPVATLGGGEWMAPGAGLFGPVPFAGRIPGHGVMSAGRMYARGLPARGLPARGLLPTPDATRGRKATRTSTLLPGVAGELLPTPRVSGGNDTTELPPSTLAGRHGLDLGPAVGQIPAPPRGGLLPTPAATAFNDGESLESWQARNQRLRELGVNGNGMGTPLAVAVQMLRTPTAQLAVNGGSQHPDKRKAGGHGPTLADEVEHALLPTPMADGERSSLVMRRGNPTLAGALLPTPQASDACRGAEPEMGGSRPSGAKRSDGLPTAAMLLPTPGACDWKGSGQTQGRDRDGRPRPAGDADLPEAVELLPTPRATDGTKGGPNQRGSSGDLMLPSASVHLDDDSGDLEQVVISLTSHRRRKDRATHGQLIIPGTTITPPPLVWDLSATAEAWGKYAPAIARWESVLGLAAPSPTAPGRDGKPRLNPVAVEWMMAAPSGWVTGVPGLSRQRILRMLGNGCVAHQAAIAAARLLAVVAELAPAGAGSVTRARRAS